MVSITSFSSKMSSTTSKVWFSTPTCHLSAPTTNSPIRAVTGALSGFGLAMTRHVLDNGGIAVATLRWPEVLADLTAQYSKDRLLVLKLDVTKPQGVVGEDQRGVRLARCRLQQCGVRPHWRGRRDARRRRPRGIRGRILGRTNGHTRSRQILPRGEQARGRQQAHAEQLCCGICRRDIR
ncbi:hypothetical protein AcW1_003028 [Taiwanofungus camphoratus]|nr:hypothetical protein AcW1_003028 [Antrodia cinnamomea]